MWGLIQSLDSPVHIPTYNSLRVNKVISKYPSGFSFHPASGLSVWDLYFLPIEALSSWFIFIILWTLSEKGSDA